MDKLHVLSVPSYLEEGCWLVTENLLRVWSQVFLPLVEAKVSQKVVDGEEWKV